MEKGFSHTANDLSKAEIGISKVCAMRKKLDARRVAAGVSAGIRSYRELCARL